MSVDGSWTLEVVRGLNVGRLFALKPGPNILGNASAPHPNIDLSSQETNSPRKMSANHAQIEVANGALSLRDLDSPGGTFVNRQRILPGQTRPLLPDDLIQLASVQVRLVHLEKSPVPAAPPPPSGPALPLPFTLQTGATCRTWDDFLTVSAQNWSALRDELTSGRLSAYLASISRPDLRPADPPKTADERLDQWISRLPTTRQAVPELEVHPSLLKMKALPGGGATRSRVLITNTGYRLLRSTLSIEPATTTWVKVAPEYAGKSFNTAESTEIPLHIEIPESLQSPISCHLSIASNAGNRRVEIRLEPTAKGEGLPEPGDASPSTFAFQEILAILSPRARIVAGILLAVAFRMLIALYERPAATRPGLAAPAIQFASFAGIFAVWIAHRRHNLADTLFAAFAGAFAGVLAAALFVASCRVVEPWLGSQSTSLPAIAVLWALLGAALAALSLVLVPHDPTKAPPS